MEYYLIFFSISVAALREVYGIKDGQKKVLFILVLILIWLFQSLRWTTGTDWNSYKNFFQWATSLDVVLQSDFENGYAVLNYIIRCFTDSYTVFLFFSCGIWGIAVYNFILSNTKNFSLVLLFLFSTTVFPIRFSLACVLVYISYNYIIKKDFISFILLILLAALIHRTALVFIPVYFLARYNYSIVILVGVYILAFIIGLDTDSLFNTALKYASYIYSDIGDSVQVKLNAYITTEKPEYSEMSLLRIVMSLINASVLIVLFYVAKKKWFSGNVRYNVLFNLYMFGLIYNRLFWQGLPQFIRISVFFGIAQVLMCMLLIDRCKNKNNRLFFSFLFVLYCFYALLNNIIGFYQDLYIPYINIFSGVNRAGY